MTKFFLLLTLATSACSSASGLKGLDSCGDTLAGCFDLQFQTVFKTGNARDAEKLKETFDRIQDKNQATDLQIKEMHKAYILARLWKQAAVFYEAELKSSATLESPPVITIADHFSEQEPAYAVVKGAKEIHLKNFDLNRGSVVVIIAHPSCHFSSNAFAEIEKHPALKMKLARHILILTPQDSTFDLGTLSAWNKSHAPFENDIIYRTSQWPGIGGRSTPEFYFFKEGRLVYKFNGWPKAGSMKSLEYGLHKIEG